ncbi:MAG: moeZ 2 [Phycisphaerales bacterium]|nr:moeZ 2 [Phycisphaerales bacterium]
MLLPQIGEAGQHRLAASRVILIGCGALGTAIADQLIRAGVGHLTIVDRDIVELTNLQRQTLFDEADASRETPKAIAAAARLRAVNSAVEIVPIVADVHAGNVHELLKSKFDVILDGTDNVQTRYLVNDASVKHGIPWVYGAAVGVEGRVMAIVPSVTPCLRCVFPTPPSPQELPACDTAGVLGMAASIVGAYQAIEAIKILTGSGVGNALMRLDFWTPRTHVVSTLDAKRSDCACCGLRNFEYLDAPPGDSAVTLCGRNAVQVRPTGNVELSLDRLEQKLLSVGTIQRSPYFLRCLLTDPIGVSLTVFPDGRSLIHGVNDLGRAKSLHARFVGS